jgi:hypothetical protein
MHGHVTRRYLLEDISGRILSAPKSYKEALSDIRKLHERQ